MDVTRSTIGYSPRLKARCRLKLRHYVCGHLWSYHIGGTQACWKVSAQHVPPVQLHAANFSASAGVVVAAPLLFCLRDDGGNFDPVAGGIDGDKRQIGRADVLTRVMNIVLDEYFDADFHRCVKDAIDRRTKDDEIAHLHGNDKVH